MTDVVSGGDIRMKDGDEIELPDGPISVSMEFKNMVSPLTKTERIAVSESVQRDGVQVPIMVSLAPSRGRIIDGFNRWEICKELGMSCPVTFRQFKTVKDEDVMALSLNAQRRQLDDLSAGLLNMRLLEVHGILGRGKKSLTGLSVADVAREAGQTERTFYRRIEMARLLSRVDCEDIREEYRAELLTATEAMTLARARKKAADEGSAPPQAKSGQTLRDVVNQLKGKGQISPLEQARMEAFSEGVRWGYEAGAEKSADPEWVLEQLTDWRQSVFDRERAAREAETPTAEEANTIINGTGA
jgi:ParB-like chromosome segregation protein Spo0J